MNDYKTQAIKRKDFRACEGDPEIPRHKPSRACKKPYSVEYKAGINTIWHFFADWTVFGRYANRRGAEQAIKSKENDYFYNKYEFEFRIVGPETE